MNWFAWVVLTIVVVGVVIALMQRFYRKSTRDAALIRTGAGGQTVALDGGVIALPFLHRIDEINMRTHRLEVKRAGEKSLITEDRLRVDLEVEFHIRVQPTVEGVATAAQAFGADALRGETLSDYLEAPFVDALQAVAATMTMDALHEGRSKFVKEVKHRVSEEVQAKGLSLESVSVTRLDQASFSALNENNAFNAVGMRKLAEIVASNKKKRAEIESDAEISVRKTQLDTMKKRLEIEREQEHATIAQVLNLAEAQADAKAKTAQKQEEAQRLSEQARIEREMEIQVAEIQKDKSLEKERQQAQLSKEIHRVEMAVALAHKQKQEAEVIAETEQVKAKVVMVQERVQTEREKAIVERERDIALARSQKDAAILMAKTKSQTDAWLVEAETKAQNIERQAQADKMRMAEEAQGRSALIQAENLTSESLLRQRLEIHRLDKLPELAAQMMKPVEKIDSIRINHIGGLESGRRQAAIDGTHTAVANISPMNQVVNSILDMALQMPVMQRVGDVLGADVQSALTSTKPLEKNDRCGDSDQ